MHAIELLRNISILQNLTGAKRSVLTLYFCQSIQWWSLSSWPVGVSVAGATHGTADGGVERWSTTERWSGGARAPLVRQATLSR